MNSVFKIGFALVIGFFVALPAGAVDTKGDEHPFPFSCFNFSGVWASETGDEYRIEQKECKRLDIARVYKNEHDVQKTTIVPDNRARKVSGEKWRGEVRHRWNAKQYGSTVETYRVKRYSDRDVSETVLLESVNSALILETVYRVNEENMPGSTPKTEHYQRIFRKVKLSDSEDGARGPSKR